MRVTAQALLQAYTDHLGKEGMMMGYVLLREVGSLVYSHKTNWSQ